MKRIARATTLAVLVCAAAAHAGAQGSSSSAGQSPVQQRPDTATQTKAREQQPAVSAQGTPNCSGRPGARCAKKGGTKKARTIF
jgi:hypothetical protein